MIADVCRFSSKLPKNFPLFYDFLFLPKFDQVSVKMALVGFSVIFRRFSRTFKDFDVFCD